jgi:molybdenum cofactor cytidylyltransferase
MKFAEMPVEEAEGAILAHGVRAGGRLLKKGRVLAAADVAALKNAGIARVAAVRLEAGDVPEDEAAARIARSFAGEHIRQGAAFTGRANLYAGADGLVVLDEDAIDAANHTNEALTIATLMPFARVAKGEMIATVKVIPYAAPERAVAEVEKIAAPMRVAPFRPLRVALISTHVAGMKPQLLDKNRTALEARLASLGGTLAVEARCAHAADGVAAELTKAKAQVDLLLVFGASAIADRRDVVPAAIEAAGGTVEHFGMPVDPGNLLLIGSLGGKPVVGLPGCARSPKLNGFDFVLQRLFASLDVTADAIMGMGIGGLLSDIPSRPQPRESAPATPRAPHIAALVLAAGTSSRMGENKLLADWKGKPIVRRTVEAALASHADSVLVVTGHEQNEVLAALGDLKVKFAHNADYAEGLSTSLRVGLKALPDCDGAIVLLGDMPEIAPTLIDRMIAAFSPDDGRAIVLATRHGKRGNPVLWARRFFADMETVSGDTGAKHLIGANEELACEVEAGDEVLSDIDTPDELAALRARQPS